MNILAYWKFGLKEQSQWVHGQVIMKSLLDCSIYRHLFPLLVSNIIREALEKNLSAMHQNIPYYQNQKAKEFFSWQESFNFSPRGRVAQFTPT